MRAPPPVQRAMSCGWSFSTRWQSPRATFVRGGSRHVFLATLLPDDRQRTRASSSATFVPVLWCAIQTQSSGAAGLTLVCIRHLCFALR